jgi:hypothetical protein
LKEAARNALPYGFSKAGFNLISVEEAKEVGGIGLELTLRVSKSEMMNE